MCHETNVNIFADSLFIGTIYAFMRVRSPAPPLVALAGVLGMVWGDNNSCSAISRGMPTGSNPSANAVNQAR